MAQLIEDIELAWSSLREHTDTSGWRSIPTATIGSCTLRAGLYFPEKSEAFLVSFSTSVISAAEKLPAGQGFFVSRLDSNDPNLTWLGLTRNEHGSTELFTAMVADVILAMNIAPCPDEKGLLRIFIGRIRSWQEFMRKGAKTLSAESEIGLMGELIVLKAIIDAGVSLVSTLESWLGPLDGLRDFEIGTGGIEVKATISSTGFPAKIASLEQLDDSVRQPLFLTGVRLRQSSAGKNLTQLIEEMRDISAGEPEAARLLDERLIASGYINSHKNYYIRRVIICDILVSEIKDSFPRLIPKNVPIGVTKAAYQIDLDKILVPHIPFIDALKRLRVI